MILYVIYKYSHVITAIYIHIGSNVGSWYKISFNLFFLHGSVGKYQLSNIMKSLTRPPAYTSNRSFY